MNYYDDLMRNYQKVNRFKDELMTAGGFSELPVSSIGSMDLAKEIINSENLGSILDVGANDRRFEKLELGSCRYYSLDQDNSYNHDYSELDEVPESLKFDIITLFAVVEHLHPKTFINDFIPFFRNHLNDNGYLVISSNNIFHNLGIRTDYSHVKAYSPRDLHAILRNFEFEKVSVYRVSLMKAYYRWLFELISRTIFKPYCIDYSPEICWIYRCPPTSLKV